MRRQFVKAENKRKIYTVLSLVAVILLLAFITYRVWDKFSQFGNDPQRFREVIESFGWAGWLVAFGIQFLQVLVAFIPGEAVEIGLGYAFGTLRGLLLCYLGVVAASALIFVLTKKIGVKIVETFVSLDKLNSLKWLSTEKKLKTMIFVLYFIPGTPKDLITYFVGMTNIKLHEFLIISSVARLPSVVSSVVGGALTENGRWVSAAVVFGVTMVISLAGLLIYSKITKIRERRSKPDDEAEKA